MSLPLVAIVGRPNVGKSTLFNRLVGGRRSLVTDEPGVTRDRVYGEVRDVRRPFRLVDTGGLVMPGSAPFAREVERQAGAALDESRVALLVVDTRAGITGPDREILAMLRRRSLAVVLVANKVDAPKVEALVPALYELGGGDPVPVSAEHGLGIEELLDAVGEALPSADVEAGVGSEDADEIRVAIVGRPNVGKSSLLNRLAGQERVMVSEVPGTTRDAIDTRLERGGRRFRVVDTAGLRRPGRVKERADSLSMRIARKSIDRADVVVLVLDAVDGIVAQDLHIAGHAHDAHRPIVVVVNKWDLVSDREDRARSWLDDVRDRVRFFKKPPVVLASAKTGQRADKILEHVVALHALAGTRISTSELNRWLQEVGDRERASPARGRSVNLLYATQTGSYPPRFAVFCNEPARVHFSLRRFLENALRERFGFGSVPLRLDFRRRS